MAGIEDDNTNVDVPMIKPSAPSETTVPAIVVPGPRYDSVVPSMTG